MPSGNSIVVLGAGPAGMSAAWRLSELGHRVVVLEKDSAVGGMGKTITVGKYSVDYGPHTFHIRETAESQQIHEAIKPFFGPDPLVLRVHRSSPWDMDFTRGASGRRRQRWRRNRPGAAAGLA